MSRTPNVIVLDATIVDASGVIIPQDIDTSDVVDPPRGYDFATLDAYQFPSRAVKSDWVVKAVNSADAAVDVVPVVSTTDDGGLEDWSHSGSGDTAATGSAPDNVAHIHGEEVAGYLAVEVSADPAPTDGTITVVFGGRLYGGA